MSDPSATNALEDVAIIGMVGRFPGASNLTQFWQNLCERRESISLFTDEEIEAAGVERAVFTSSNYVKAGGIIEDVDLFAAPFFGFTPREAEIMDPQQRVFLECAWEVLENAGYDPETYSGRIGVYAGAGINGYLLNIYSNPRLQQTVSAFQALIGNEKDHLATLVSYKLNLKGPSISLQTTCSTSLVAVTMACQSLLCYQCDMALAGGVSIKVPQKSGYVYEEGGIGAPDGHCRAFDAKARGTVGGDGAGVVVLKRLSEALADGDHIHAVIKGSALNNDGSAKVGYTAPSVDGQAEVIAEALAMARVNPETITFVEAHGTGTTLGDPIEVAALTQAFRTSTQKKSFCALGSVKTNVGHLNTAAGVAGLIKTTLALEHKLLPPTVHFEQPNPRIDFASSPFFVNTELANWTTNGGPRRAGVSSFGIGGTNAHVILEEAPLQEPSGKDQRDQLLVLSAKTESALNNAAANLAAYLKSNTEVNLADVAYTLQVGRRGFAYRRMLVCDDVSQAINALESPESTRAENVDRPVVMMFSGQGSQYVNMARGLYQQERVFREHVDRCSEILLPHLKLDLRNVIYKDEEQSKLDQTFLAQPALFVIEYSLAQLWMCWGVRPEAMIGHSIGEYVAACLAGVISLEDALMLVAARGRLMQQLPAGSMLAVSLAEKDVRSLLDEDGKLSLAAVNAPALCVVSGRADAVEDFAARCAEKGAQTRLLHTSHAFHSATMKPMLGEFLNYVQRVKLNAPRTPYISNVTGQWITGKEATTPSYWTQHVRETVRFADGINELSIRPGRIFLEVGPGRTLSTSVRQAHASLPGPNDKESDTRHLLNTLGKLWLAGATVDWEGFKYEKRRRLPLPTYPFERQRYWVERVNNGFIKLSAPQVSEQSVASTILRPSVAPAESTSTYVAPRNQVESTIAGVWQDVLGVSRVGIHDNFFDLGGNSLLGIQLVSMLRKAFLLEMPMNSIFESPTVAEQAVVISETQRKESELEELDQMLKEIEALSAEELESQLALIEEQSPINEGRLSNKSGRMMDFSLFFFSHDASKNTENKYQLLMESARFADANNFSAVWTPERHFQDFGGLYPNPSVLSAALATITKNVEIRAGSVALPLHNPIRVAEEWSVVDNLSNGRVGIAFASGWHTFDFVLSPNNYKDRKEHMFENIQIIRKLWRGETVTFQGVNGQDAEVRIMPKPVQRDLPTWVSISNDTRTWVKAGEIGANVLTAILRQPLEDLAEKIHLYREARAKHGHDPDAGQITVMLHTFVGEDLNAVKEIVRPSLTHYFRSNIKQFERHTDLSVKGQATAFDPDNLTEADLDVVASYYFERYFEQSLLCGTPDKCSQLVDRLSEVGVSEIACFIDFGVSPDLVLGSLPHLNVLRERHQEAPKAQSAFG